MKDGLVWAAGLRGDVIDDIDSIGLKSLILLNNSLSDSFLQGLSVWMKHDPYMRHLDLRCNSFSKPGLQEFSKTI